MSSLLSLLAATLVLVANVYSQDLTVELDQGIIQGSVGSTVSGVTFYSFLGIPYAQPPVGELRFKAPQEAPSWKGVRDASTVGSNCVQVEGSVEGSEDCLFINVYTPQLPRANETTSLLPVMVWIHGGGFIELSADPSLFGPGYLLDKEILLVSFNYRLGALGFLGLSHSEVSLNNGLKDQRAALRWVQQNIERFGGDPARTTIFGESAGGSSVDYHLISPSTSANVSSIPWDQLNNDFESFLPHDLNLKVGTKESLQAAALVRETYFGNETASLVTLKQYVDLLTDSMFLEGMHRMVNFRLRYNSAPIYVYQFSYQGRLSYSYVNHFNYTFPGAAHGDDVTYLFGASNQGLESNSTEVTTVHRMVTLWTNFAKSLDLGEGLDLTWDPVEESKQTYLDINTDLSVHNLLELHPERRAVWDALYSDVDN